jgi:hypothetical protein
MSALNDRNYAIRGVGRKEESGKPAIQGRQR